jgi:hypothetical protein
MSSHNHKRTGLFLMQVWIGNAPDGSAKSVYEGKVQRVVDGRVSPRR